MPNDKATPQELKDSISSRVAARALDRHERYLSLLRLATQVRQDNGYDTSTLKEALVEGDDEREALCHKVGGRIAGRKRPKLSNGVPCKIFMDECGQHLPSKKKGFGSFVLAAVVVPDEKYADLDRRWKVWKARVLGSSAKIVHEPNVRKGNGPFFFSGNRERQAHAIGLMDAMISRLDFLAFACVTHRADYFEDFGEGALDGSLPDHPYAMALDFLCERIVMGCQLEFGGVRAQLVAEARGPLDDARVQYEFARLHIEGTSYVSAAWFREYLEPGIEFRAKKDNISGLQIADLLARPCGEKVLHPESTPARWPQFRDKLCTGRETDHSILGLKVTPWHDRYEEIWKS